MIKLHGFGEAFGESDLSPFVVKVDVYLRMTGTPFEKVQGDPRKAPKRKLPLLEVDGRQIADSSAIIEHMESKRGEKLDAQLDAKQRAVGEAFKSMLEEHLYFVVLAMRWQMDDGWSIFLPHFREILGKAGVPSFLRGMIGNSVRKKTIAQLHAQGTGRHTRDEIVATGKRLVDALDDQLSGVAFLLGDRRTTYDATAYAFCRALLVPAFDNELRKHAAARKHLASYVERMNEALTR